MDEGFFTDEALNNLSDEGLRELLDIYNKPLLFEGPFENDGETVTFRTTRSE